jgi:hypothetical protein
MPLTRSRSRERRENIDSSDDAEEKASNSRGKKRDYQKMASKMHYFTSLIIVQRIDIR